MGKLITLLVVLAVVAGVLGAGKYVAHMKHTNDFSDKSQDLGPSLRRASQQGPITESTIRSIVQGWATDVGLKLADADVQVLAYPVGVSGGGSDCAITEMPAVASKMQIADMGAVKNLAIRCLPVSVVGFKATFRRPGGSRVSVERYSFASPYSG